MYDDIEKPKLIHYTEGGLGLKTIETLSLHSYGKTNFMICLSKNPNDEYINMFANGSNYHSMIMIMILEQVPIVIRSMGKRKLIDRCWQDNITFYYMDSGYFGNYASKTNPMVGKIYP